MRIATPAVNHRSVAASNVFKVNMLIAAVAAWRSGNGIKRINEVAVRRVPLILGWVTVFGGQTTSVFHQVT